jgi:spore maturation protein CgeB
MRYNLNMRIFYASDTTPNASLSSNLWRNNLYMPLVDLGHDVVEFDYDFHETFQNLDPTSPVQAAYIKKNRPKLTKELIHQIKTAHAEKPIDLFFSYFYDACVLPEAIDEIRSMGITAMNWYCNGSYQLHLVSEISPHYDWCLVPEKFRLKDYEAMGAHPIYCQEAANPTIYKPYYVPIEFDVTFVGQAYGDRPAYIKYLLDQGIDVQVWGFGWQNFNPEQRSAVRVGKLKRAAHIGRILLTPAGRQAAMQRLKRMAEVRQGNCAMDGVLVTRVKELPAPILGGALSDEDMIKLYSRSKINLGFSSCGETHQSGERILQVRLRDFEVPMSGGFYMVEYMEELEEFFEIDKELVCYDSPQDLAKKIKYYLTHDDEREQIRKAGYERCLREHTWHQRFEMVFEKTGLA